MFPIEIADGRGRFDVGSDDVLLRAALRAGLGFPYECNAGACGSCKFQLISGDLVVPTDLAPAETERDRARGRYLACRVSARSACTIKIRTDATYVPCHAPRRFEAQLAEKTTLTSDMSEFVLVSETPAAFLAGQYALLSLAADGPKRVYSMANVPNDRGEWRFIVKRVPGGAFSDPLFRLPIGTNIHIDGPYGTAFARPEIDRDVVCIAGGAGFSQMLSVARGLAGSGRMQSRTLRFYYGGRRSIDVPSLQQISDLASQVGDLRQTVVVSDPDDEPRWNGPTGFVHDVLGRDFTDGWADHEYYLSGPPPMVDATLRMLVMEKQIPHERIHFDRFF
ncbi:FAD-binding oxidoreductase [Labrys monachus]|uniref:FAD-binding oxidoreductase n=1 Tax=Labrys monachus TaxID=217067 RepID=UPI0027D81430|nr:FAD-binding oxidoreductase [Labrys monachus]